MLSQHNALHVCVLFMTRFKLSNNVWWRLLIRTTCSASIIKEGHLVLIDLTPSCKVDKRKGPHLGGPTRKHTLFSAADTVSGQEC